MVNVIEHKFDMKFLYYITLWYGSYTLITGHHLLCTLHTANFVGEMI